ncbi:MAG TPA: Gfo/Idh/MocA family oxidoreductase [Gemmatimonadales bacterium]|nr:Gfo/Idh/MocA family oxidoreductase [Gemmatimonadales bacterium]
MRRIKIYGAGSIGNHLAHASRRMGWEVTVCDVSAAALERMQHQIYPSRYGSWDPAIRLCLNQDAPTGGFDHIFIGTPPEFHLPLALQALDEEPTTVIVEKPVCPPSLAQAQELWAASQARKIRVYVGYDHVVGRAAQKAEELISSGESGETQTLDVEFREHWGGIFAAHPWLDGPSDSYLGFWEKGGGASGEHSHAINLWQHFAHVVGAGRVAEVEARIRYVAHGGADYDDLCLLNLRTEQGLLGRVVQDVVTTPHRKRARIQGTTGAIEWVCNYNADGDAVVLLRPGKPDEVLHLPKKRPDDFIRELEHIEADLRTAPGGSGIRLERGLDTMLVVAAAHRSEQEGRRIRLDYNLGYSLDALGPADEPVQRETVRSAREG